MAAKYSTVSSQDEEAQALNPQCTGEQLNDADEVGSVVSDKRDADTMWCCGLSQAYKPGIKTAILGSVVLQNTGYALVRRYSRAGLGEQYSTSSVLVVMEFAKLALSMIQIVIADSPSDVPSGSALFKYGYLVRRSCTMLVPAAIYLVMNILGFLGLQYIDAATFSIIAQMKIFSTALFSVIVLGRQLHPRKWRALATLTLGVILISTEAMPKRQAAAATLAHREWKEYLIGMAACFGDVILSGFVSIYFEKVLKSKTETFSVWDRNLQLSFWSILIYTPLVFYDNPTDPFHGWSRWTLACAATGALGGVLVALSIKHADSIMKTIATTGSIVLTTLLNACFLDGPFTLPIITGGLVVLISVCNYNDNGGA